MKYKPHINDINHGLVRYFNRIDKKMKKFVYTRKSLEEKELYLSDMFEELKRDFFGLNTHQTTAVHLHRLMNYANASQIEGLLKCFMDTFEEFVAVSCSLPAVEGLFNRATHFFDSDNGHRIMELFYQIGMMMLDSEKFMSGNCSGRLISWFIEALSGYPRTDKGYEPVIPVKEHHFYPQFADLLQSFADHLLPTSIGLCDQLANIDNIKVLLQVFQKLDPKRSIEVCRAIIHNGLFHQLDCDGLPLVLTNRISSVYCSALVQAIDEECIDLFIEIIFQPRFNDLIVHPVASRVVQRLIACEPQKQHQLKRLYDLMRGRMYRLVAENRAGVVIQLCQSAMGNQFTPNLLLEEWKETGNSTCNFIVSIAVGSPSHNLENWMVCQALKRITEQKSRILQSMMPFVNTHFTVLTAEQKVNLSCSKCGCYFVKKLLNVEEASFIEEFILSLKESCQKLVTDVYGSSIFLSCWNTLAFDQKKEVIGHLAKSVGQIMETVSGKCVAHLIGLNLYLKSRPKWERSVCSGMDWAECKTRKRKSDESLQHVDLQVELENEQDIHAVELKYQPKFEECVQMEPVVDVLETTQVQKEVETTETVVNRKKKPMSADGDTAKLIEYSKRRGRQKSFLAIDNTNTPKVKQLRITKKTAMAARSAVDENVEATPRTVVKKEKTSIADGEAAGPEAEEIVKMEPVVDLLETNQTQKEVKTAATVVKRKKKQAVADGDVGVLEPIESTKRQAKQKPFLAIDMTNIPKIEKVKIKRKTAVAAGSAVDENVETTPRTVVKKKKTSIADGEAAGPKAEEIFKMESTKRQAKQKPFLAIDKTNTPKIEKVKIKKKTAVAASSAVDENVEATARTVVKKKKKPIVDHGAAATL